MKKKGQLMIQISLTSLILIFVSIHTFSAWKTYLLKTTIKSKVESGSSLAERYMILGDWPASNNNSNAIYNHNRYLVTQSKKNDSSK
ncbi:MAG: hypothetical protein ACI9ES_001617 [Oceanospirillaceae bacterium]|jgi:hypothetical protein